MKTLEDIKQEIAVLFGFKDKWDLYKNSTDYEVNQYLNAVAEQYAAYKVNESK